MLLHVHCIQPYERTSTVEELAIAVGQVESADTVRTALFWQDIIAFGLSIMLIGFLASVVVIEHSGPGEQPVSGKKAALSISSTSVIFASVSTSTTSTAQSLYVSSASSTLSKPSTASAAPASQESGLSSVTSIATITTVSVHPALTPIPKTGATPVPSPKPSSTVTTSSSRATTTTTTSTWTHTYIVRFGDTLDSIATRFHVDPKVLAERNHIKNPNLLLVGQRLQVP